VAECVCNKVPVAQLDRVPASEAVVLDTQPQANKALTEHSEINTRDYHGQSSYPVELQELIDHWDDLPEHVRQTIQMLVDAAGGDSD